MVAPTVRASTTKRARKDEVFNKMSTVRGFGGDPSMNLKRAMAEVISAGKEGRDAMSQIAERLNSQQKNLRPSHKK
jgi:hypothetical protein